MRRNRGYTQDSGRFLDYLGLHRGAEYDNVVDGCRQEFGWPRHYTDSLIRRLLKKRRIQLDVTVGDFSR